MLYFSNTVFLSHLLKLEINNTLSLECNKPKPSELANWGWFLNFIDQSGSYPYETIFQFPHWEFWFELISKSYFGSLK